MSCSADLPPKPGRGKGKGKGAGRGAGRGRAAGRGVSQLTPGIKKAPAGIKKAPKKKTISSLENDSDFDAGTLELAPLEAVDPWETSDPWRPFTGQFNIFVDDDEVPPPSDSSTHIFS